MPYTMLEDIYMHNPTEHTNQHFHFKGMQVCNKQNVNLVHAY